ncbi:MAG TPA: hypothetical protein VGR07_07330, partial [Thermoanaerobaculia bacterium]|nr:hypothetical protein [Thermoanaerobaculia bacterium]
PRLEQKYAAVVRILEELKLDGIERLVVLNKADLVDPGEAAAWTERYDGVAVSAAKREGMTDLISAAEARLGRGEPLIKRYEAESPSA